MKTVFRIKIASARRFGLRASLCLFQAAALLQAASFTSVGPFALGDSPDFQSIQQPATNPYPLTLDVSGFNGLTTLVTLSMTLSHTFPDDLNFLLVSPTGQALQVMSNAGGSGALTICKLNFADSASIMPQDTGVVLICNGTYLPGAAYTTTTLEPYASPAPGGPYGTTFSVFQGFNPNGAWTLYIGDDGLADTGSLASWSLTINDSAVPEPSSVGLAAAGLVGVMVWKRKRTRQIRP